MANSHSGHSSVVIRELVLLDELLEPYRSRIGADFTAYRNHVYRVVNLCAALSPDGTAGLDRFCIAAVFHDLGIWTAGTFDYLPPSIALAQDYLLRNGRSEWSAEIGAMILDHHKVTAAAGPWPTVEVFRRADWVDVSLGLRPFGLPRTTVAAIRSAWPNAGFHRCLVRLALRRWWRHPLSPLPMFRL